MTGVGAEPRDVAVVARDVPCQAACPAETDIPAYIHALAEGDPDRSHLLNQESNVFPGVLGRVCTRPCEARCRHTWTNTQGPVTICLPKREAADGKSAPAAPRPAWFGPSGRRVAVVGAGPAGLSAARELARYGHQVDVYEREPEAGGMMRYGIPVFRLPRAVVVEEIAAITGAGVPVHVGRALDGAAVAGLSAEHDAVLLATGTTRPHALALAGAAPEQLLSGLAFMHRYNGGRPRKLRAPVVVIGGGLTAR